MTMPCLSLMVALGLIGCFAGPVAIGQETKESPAVAKEDAKSKASKEKDASWTPLLKLDSLEGWEKTNFGGEGEVEIKEGVLRLALGDPLTGIHTKAKDLPKENYELRWKARRVEGSDFFAGVTFPIGEEHASFICGGWGGGLVGVSSINGNDASENETASFESFKNKQWYNFRIRVDKTHLKVWIDDKEVVSVAREGKKFSLRAEVFRCRPLGYCCFQSVCEVKDWEIQKLP